MVALAAAGDDDDLGAAGGDGLFDAVLDQGLVDQAEHLLGDGLGGGQKTSAHASGRKDSLANFHGHLKRSPFRECRPWCDVMLSNLLDF